MVTIEQVMTAGDTMTAPGPYGVRTVALSQTDSGWSAHEQGRPISGPWVTRVRLIEEVMAILCPEDASVPGSRAAQKLERSRDAARIAASNARWAAVMATTEPEPE